MLVVVVNDDKGDHGQDKKITDNLFMYLLLYPEMLGVEFLALCILRKCSAIELHMQSPRDSLKFFYLYLFCVYA